MKRLLIVGSAALAISCGGGREWPRQERAPGANGIAFVDNQVCAECHAPEFEQWLGSDHDQSMKPATEESVLGDFNDTEFDYFGMKSRFFRRDGKFIVNTEGPDGILADFEVTYTFGLHPLQQYLIQFPGGRLQCLTIAWDTESERWFHLYPDEQIKAGDPLHWTGRYQRWNLMCAECHSTNLRKNYDSRTDTYQTAWDEINVSCQACHGPGAEHVKWARILPRDYTPRRGEHKLVVDFAKGDSRYQVQQCARCHSRRHMVSEDDLHGREFMEDFQVATLREGLYHADGQILDEVYVYGSFLQTQMYRRGVRCSDCHNPHTLKQSREGNAVCTACHQTETPLRFPTLKKKNYDTPEHHFHQAGGEGASCVNCHMPERTYMGVDPRSDHSFRIPRPDLSVKIGTPNTCNDCHRDKSPKWAAQAFAEWYGKKEAAPHYAETLAAGREMKPEAGEALIELATDLGQPAIVRATAVELLRRYGPEATNTLLKLSRDEDSLVRTTALGGLDRLPPMELLPEVAPMLDDPIRAVRIEAARLLASAPEEYFSDEHRVAFEAALDEYRSRQEAHSDTPDGHMNLGIVEAAAGHSGNAVQHYEQAIAMDAYFLPAQLNLATLYNQLGRNADAEKVLRAAIERSPENGDLRYSLGLLLAEENRLEEAANSLGKAAQLMPSRARVRYNFALALQHLGKRSEAEKELLSAHVAEPEDTAIVNALVIFYIQQKRPEQAITYAVKLVNLAPGQPGPREMLDQIERELGARR